MSNYPKIRPGLTVENLHDECLVFNPETHQASCLKQPTACIFSLADGSRSIAELATRASQSLGREISEDTVSAALDTLKEADLLEPDLGRRRFLKAGLASTLVPAIIVMTAQAAEAR